MTGVRRLAQRQEGESGAAPGSPSAIRGLIDKPWLVKIELTEGCNLRCKFCPVYSRPEFHGPQHYLQPALAESIAAQLAAWTPEVRIEFTMRGEPTLNPDAHIIIEKLREQLPRAQMTMFTNGTVWLKDVHLPTRLFGAGLNVLNVDCYNGTYERFQTRAAAHVREYGSVELSDFRTLSTYAKIPHGWQRRIINLVPDIADPTHLVRVRKVHNMAGNLSRRQEERFGMAPTPPGSVHKRCARPFRELAMFADGTIVICCLDWSGVDVLGTVQDGIEAAWYGPKHHAIMVALFDRRREHGACATCNYDGGARLGLLRDPTTGASYRDRPRRPRAVRP